MIECNLAEIKKISTNNKVVAKKGLYSSCMFHGVKGFGTKTWVVIVNIDLDYEKFASEGKSLADITEECIEYLNTPPKSKYGKRRKRKPLYGLFHEKPYRSYLKEKGDKKYIQAMLLVGDRKRSCFWGQGEKMSFKR
jgi:hypothetical protein